MIHFDVPSPINFHVMRDAREWESKAMDRPFRLEFFEKIAEQLEFSMIEKALELGSGPGFLANHICNKLDRISLVLLDFSDAMHQLAETRLQKHIERISLLKKDFKEPGWTSGLGKFECITTVQAVHELRNKNHAKEFHKQVKRLIARGGMYLVCDHFYGEGGMNNDQLFMSVEEHTNSLADAGFRTEVLMKKGSLILVKAT